MLLDIPQDFRQNKPLQKFVTDDPLIMPDNETACRLEDCFVRKSFFGRCAALDIIDNAVVKL